MSIIEQLGGYAASMVWVKEHKKHGVEFSALAALNVRQVENALLEYRRANNIFEVGDKVVKAARLNDDSVYQISEIADSLNWVKSSCGVFIDAPMFKHATDAERQAGKRLPRLEILNDIDIPPNTIILGDK